MKKAIALWFGVTVTLMFFTAANGHRIYLAEYHSDKTVGRLFAKAMVPLRATRSFATVKEENVIDYTYKDRFGEKHQRECKVEPETWAKFQVNDPIPIEYVIDSPSVSYIDTSEERFSRMWKEVVLLVTTFVLAAAGVGYFSFRCIGPQSVQNERNRKADQNPIRPTIK